MTYRDGFMVMSFLCHHGGKGRNGICIEGNRRVWDDQVDLMIFFFHMHQLSVLTSRLNGLRARE